MEFQKTPQWYVDRLGKFTGAEFWKLMTGGRRGMTPEEFEAEKAKCGKRKTIDTLFGDVAMTYIEDKIAEITTNGTCIDYKSFETKETKWGNYWEPIAKEAFTAKTGILINPVGFINISERFGSSPDGETIDASFECKCPYNTMIHNRNLRLKDSNDLKEQHKNYYTQVQIEIMALKKDKGYFVSFDPRNSEKLQLKIIEVPRDEEMIKEILYRKEEALKVLNSIMNELITLIY
jgi:hypothetical protein